MTTQPFPAAPYGDVLFPDDDFLVVPLALADADVPPGAVVLWLLLARLSEGHPEVEVSAGQLERHTGSTAHEIGEYVRALAADGWLKMRQGRMPGTVVYRILRRPTVEQIKEWAEDLAEPMPPTPEAQRPSGPPASPRHSAAFWRGLAD